MQAERPIDASTRRSSALPPGSRDYAPMQGVPDELIGPDGASARALGRASSKRSQVSAAERRRAPLRRRRRAASTTWASPIACMARRKERTWPLSRLPLLLAESRMARHRRWRRPARRASRPHSARRLWRRPPRSRSGALPPAAVAGSPEFIRAMCGVKPPGGRWLRFYAADIGRGPDGHWWVLGDRAQAPSGAGYALENRLVLSRAFPQPVSRHEGRAARAILPRFPRQPRRRRDAPRSAHLPADAGPVQRDLFRTGQSRALSRLPARRGRRSRHERGQAACAHHRRV